MNQILTQLFSHWFAIFGIKTIHAGQFSSYGQRPVLTYTILDEKRHTTRAKFYRRYEDATGEIKIEMLSPAIATIQIDYVDNAQNFDAARDFSREFYDYLLSDRFLEFTRNLEFAFLPKSAIRELSNLLPTETESVYSFDAELRYADKRIYDDSVGIIETVENIVYEGGIT